MSCTVIPEYTSKLHTNEWLWQRPVDTFHGNTIYWYTNQVLGKNTLAGMMKTICRQAGLERELNNHSIRATSITVLDVNTFSNRDIMFVSGHRSETSTYTSRVSVQRKHEMSMALTEAVIPKVTTETVNEHEVVNEAERGIVCDVIINLTPAEIEEFMVPMECERPLNLNIQVAKEVTPRRLQPL